MDINAPDFEQSFKLENGVVGIIGQGFVGSAMRAYFDRKVATVCYDKYKPTSHSLEDVINKSDIVFVCVPTPMRQSGECYTGIVESVLDDITSAAALLGRPLDTFVVCIKSTVPPGFTNRQRALRPGMRIVFSPEFLTEKNSINDMLHANRVIVGGPQEDAHIVLRFFLTMDQRRVDEGKCVLIWSQDASAAEMAKLFANGLLFTKVLFSNEVARLCQALGVSYEEARTMAVLDPRIGSSHTRVPGPDGFLGAGGHCFPKDMHNLKFIAKQVGVAERLFTAVLQRNGEVREEKDWEKMEDRAVTDK